jgi:hypothetical protein
VTELEMTQLCAEAVGYRVAGTRDDFDRVKAIPVEQFPGAPHYQYAPLADASCALALLVKFGLILEPESADGQWAATWINRSKVKGLKTAIARYAPTPHRAIVECAAQVQQQIRSTQQVTKP